MKYKQLAKEVHPEYDAEYWAQLDALYAGGKKLLRDKKLLKTLFPQHNAEEKEVYEERCKRAFYTPYFGQIIDYVVAALMGDPIEVSLEDGEADDPFYDEFFEKVNRGHHKLSLNEFIRDRMQVALVCGRAWSLVELPRPPKEGEEAPANLAEQEQRGALDAYVCPLAPEIVKDWECDEDGNLIWALLHTIEQKRTGAGASRKNIREVFTEYYPDRFVKYAIEYNPDEKPPTDETEVPVVDEGPHSFGSVPLVCLEMPEGLWAGNKIASLATEHFNKDCALSWGEYRTLFQFLVAFLASSLADPTNPVTDNPNRAMDQKIGAGRMMVLGSDDRLEYKGPDPVAFEVLQARLHKLRDEMFRVLHHMALSVDNSGAALQRSGESKQVDQSAAAVVLGALGLRALEHAEDLYEKVAAGRHDEPKERKFAGMSEFDEITLVAMLEEAFKLESIELGSATWKRLYKGELARKTLRNLATKDNMEEIRREQEQTFSQEDVMAIVKSEADSARGVSKDALAPRDATKKPPAKKKKK